MADQELTDLQVADYIVWLLAYGVYSRWVEDQAEGLEDEQDAVDDLIDSAVRLGRMFEQRAEFIENALLEKIPEAQKKTIKQAFRTPVTSRGLWVRSQRLAQSLKRAGVAVVNKLFDNRKAATELKEALRYYVLDDEPTALAKIANITLRVKRLEQWIDQASAISGGGQIQNLVITTSSTASDTKEQLLKAAVHQEGGGDEESVLAGQKREGLIQEIEQTATLQAKRVLERNGEEDSTPTKSEVTGMVQAAIAASKTDTTDDSNLPPYLKDLDPLQRAAVYTDGKVLISAGAGSGKTKTVAARCAYLLNDKKIPPSQVFVGVFNKVAAQELQERIAGQVGESSASQMTIGTMNATFLKFIQDNGSDQEKAALRQGFIGSNGAAMGALSRAVEELLINCLGEDKERPSSKQLKQAITLYHANGIDPKTARANAQSPMEKAIALGYECYEGLKGAVQGWKLPCESKRADTFLYDNRGRGRLTDFNDQIKVWRDILVRAPNVRAAIQRQFKHFIVDESQDMNALQTEVLDLMTQHVGKEKGTSRWKVGDQNQAIYGFRGARPDLFLAEANQEGVTVRPITYNYRCPPEVVEFANRLISHNENRMDQEAKPSPYRDRGVDSVKVWNSGDEQALALQTLGEIKGKVKHEGSVEKFSDFAVLARTRKELNNFETACIVNGVPYKRAGRSSFMGSPEVQSFMSYVNIVSRPAPRTPKEFKARQKDFVGVLLQPNNFFMSEKAATQAVQETLKQYARYKRVSVEQLDPLALLHENRFRIELIEQINTATNKKGRKGWQIEKDADTLIELKDQIDDIAQKASDERYSTEDLFNDILDNVEKTVWDGRKRENVTTSFRKSLVNNVAAKSDDESDDDVETEDEDKSKIGLGNVQYLFLLAKPNADDPEDLKLDPSKPDGFLSKMDRYAEMAKNLNVDDPDEWARNNPGKEIPEGVLLSTAHKTKGAQYPNVYIPMPKGMFPLERKPDPAKELTGVKQEEELEQERRLAYVAMTRPTKNLTILSPSVMNGRSVGPSRFITEAGLVPGENIPKVKADEPKDFYNPVEPKEPQSEEEDLFSQFPPKDGGNPEPPKQDFEAEKSIMKEAWGLIFESAQQNGNTVTAPYRDEIADALDSFTLEDIIDKGDHVLYMGEMSDGRPWEVALQRPQEISQEDDGNGLPSLEDIDIDELLGPGNSYLQDEEVI